MVKRRWIRIDAVTRRRMVGLAAQGWSQRQIGRELGRHNAVVGAVLNPLGGVRRSDMWWEPSPADGTDEHLTIRRGPWRRWRS